MRAEGKVGPYTILRRLGIGGTSEVLLATSNGPFGFERRVVIKRLLPQCEVDPAISQMLACEALAYARLSHPAIVRLYEFFAADGQLALVLEHVDGTTLARLRTTLRARGATLGDLPAYYVAHRIFSALAAAHAARDPATGSPAAVIHRDVSPGNVLVPWDGFVKLADFGIAKVSGTSSDTRDGLIKGTDGYMAPEQITGKSITPGTDVYAGCLLLRELLLGAPAFERGELSELEFLRAMAEPHLAPLESLRGGVPPSIADALRRGLAQHASHRTLSAQEMAGILRGAGDLERGREELVAVLETLRPTDGAFAAATPEPPATAAEGRPADTVGHGSVGSVRAQVIGTPYAYTPMRPPAPTGHWEPFLGMLSPTPQVGRILAGAMLAVTIFALSAAALVVRGRGVRANAAASASAPAACSCR